MSAQARCSPSRRLACDAPATGRNAGSIEAFCGAGFAAPA